MEWRWALPWAPLWLMLFFVLSKKNYKARTNCQISTNAMWMTHQQSKMYQQLKPFWWLWTTVIHPYLSPWRLRLMVYILPFVGIEICKKGCKLVTSVYRKPTNTGLLLHHQSHVNKHYKRSLVKTMLNRAFRLSSIWDLFTAECERLKLMFSNLKYPDSLISSTIAHFVTSVMSRDTIPTPQADNIHRIVLPFKDQRSADIVKKHLSDLSNKIDHILQPVFRSRKLGDDLKVQEPKPPMLNQQCVVYNFVCDLCDADYVGYTSRHLHQRIDEDGFFAIGKHLKSDHNWRPDKQLHHP